ncbi:MAG: tetratricopeptide repeat protein [Bacteroidetes bacterium]|nr:tetratricopeptide repeat protein [Bacteroidota bacterium]
MSDKSHSIASLKLLLKVAKHDTVKLDILVAIIESSGVEEGLKYGQQTLELADKLLKESYSTRQKNYIKRQKSVVLNNMATFCQRSGNVELAIDYFTKSIVICREIEDKKGTASILHFLGDLNTHRGDIAAALLYYGQSLKLREEIKDKKGIAQTLNNMGSIYSQQKDLVKALDYFERSLKLREEIKDKNGIAKSLNSIGILYKTKGKLDLALEYYNKSLKIREELNDKQGIAISLNNIGLIYKIKGDYEKSLTFFTRSLNIKRSLDEKEGISTSFNNIGNILFAQKKYSIAHAYADSSLLLSKDLGFPYNIQHAASLNSRIDSAMGNFAAAFENYKLFIIYRDSINNEGTRKASIKSQLNYEFEKKEAVIKEQQEKERAVSEEKNRFQKIVILSVGLGFLLVTIFAAVILRTLKTTRKQKIIIETKQKEILDSIYYAKRIQISLLPSEKYIQKNLKQFQNNP